MKHQYTFIGGPLAGYLSTPNEIPQGACIHVAVAENPDLTNKPGQQPALDRTCYVWNSTVEAFVIHK